VIEPLLYDVCRLHSLNHLDHTGQVLNHFS
jgi:hypothetical protein